MMRQSENSPWTTGRKPRGGTLVAQWRSTVPNDANCRIKSSERSEPAPESTYRLPALHGLLVWTAGAMVLLCPTVASSQPQTISPPPAETQAFVQVSADLTAGAFDRLLPFDVPFFITGRAPERTVGVAVQYAVVTNQSSSTGLSWSPAEPILWQPDRPTGPDQPFMVFVRTPLEARRRYLFRLSFSRDQASELTVTIEGATSRSIYVGADIGVLYAGDIRTGAVYVGSNIYFRPVTKDAPPGGISRRLAMTVGVTLSSIADEDNRTRSNLFWTQSLVLGGGYRLTSSVRCGAGALIFLESDPNPLISEKSIASTWYVSFSFDFDVGKGLHR
jgi:hypothetical protein